MFQLVHKSCIVFFLVISMLSSETVPSESPVASLRSKIIKKSGTIQIWNRTTRQMASLTDATQIESGKTLILSNHASLHITFEPLIEVILTGPSTIGVNNVVVDRSKGTIRMLFGIEKGTFKIKAPPQPRHLLLFSLKTPSAQFDASAIQMTLTVDSTGRTVTDIHRGITKIIPVVGGLKTTLKSGQRCTTYSDNRQMQIIPIPTTTTKQLPRPSEQKQPSIGILSIQPSRKIGDNLEPISNNIAQEFEMATKAKILFLDDIRRLLHSEGNEQLLTCYSDSCISKIGSNAGVDIVIVGSVNQLGTTYVLDLKMIDVLRDKLLSRTSVNVTDDLGNLLSKIPSAINHLVTTDTVITSVTKKPFNNTDTTTNQYQEKVVWIFPGTFSMGSHSQTGDIDELPPHKVTLDGFFIDRFEVTRNEFENVMGYNPVPAKGCGTCPVTNVTWQEASDYCSKLGKRLPTEAEWEYACRAGTTTPFYTSVTLSSDQANFNAQKPYGGSPIGKYKGKVVPIGVTPPNSWNLHDMYGNAAEWCSDWYDIAYYGNASEKNPQGPPQGKLKVVRGGSWNSAGADVRSSNRIAYNAELRLNTIGFRCVQSDVTTNKQQKK